MSISIGDNIPDVTLSEYLPAVGEGCGIGPRAVKVQEELANKTVAIVGVPGAFTPTCSGSHLPGFVNHADAFRVAGVDEIWCVSVNDAFVMGAWAVDQKTSGKVRMLADGDAAFAKATGLVLDLTGKGLGVRSQRFSILVRNGKVLELNIDVGGGLAVSDAGTILEQARKHGGQKSPSAPWSAADFVTKTITENPLTVFTTTTCPYCTLAKRVLSSVGATYHEVNLDKHEHGNAIFSELERRTGRSTVPNVFVKDTSIGGGSDVEQLQKDGKLVDILTKGGVKLA